MAFWSIATIFSGFTHSYRQLFLSRAAVGVGESCYGSVSPSFIAEHFPKEKRAKILAIFSTFEHPTFDLIHHSPILLLGVLLVQNAKFLPIEPDTPKTIFTIMAMQRVLHVLTANQPRAEVATRGLLEQSAIITVDDVKSASRVIIPVGTIVEIIPALIIPRAIHPNETFRAIRTVREIFPDTVFHFLVEVFWPVSVALNVLREFFPESFGNIPLRQIDLLPPLLPFPIGKLLVPPQVFFVALVPGAKTIFTIAAIKKKGALAAVVAFKRVTAAEHPGRMDHAITLRDMLSQINLRRGLAANEVRGVQAVFRFAGDNKKAVHVPV